ncbi:MAG: sulfatase-like hydrolase/transferase [Gammaproteobacteria bacterium]|nr:sulfatase-like hydrolase/transferase [Gammaproteobacteria bacterium]
MNLTESKLKYLSSWLKSRRVRYVALLALSLFVVLAVMRVGFYWYFSTEEEHLATDLFLNALYIGFKFDLRLAILAVLPVLLLETIPKINAILNKITRWISVAYLVVVFTLIMLMYFVDFGHYAYLNERLNATALQFADDMVISAEMVWQTYPVVWLVILLSLLILAFVLAIRFYIYPVLDKQYRRIGILERVIGVTLFGCILLFGIYGKLSWYPLRWSDAFFTKSPFVNAVAVNPVLFFYDTLHNKQKRYDKAKAEKHFPLMAKFLGIDAKLNKPLDYSRVIAATDKHKTPPNIVYVILESFGANQYGLFGNSLDSTPYLDELGRQGLVFDRFSIPTGGGTARSVFTAMTGIPDVYPEETASHNPLLIDQHLIMNEFDGYEKYYLLGGSASWRNIRGFLTQNIKGLQLFEEGSYSEPRVDVWGISDLSLFREANKVLKKSDHSKPFIAVIQTAGNHRPYTIPEDNEGFEVKSLPEDKKQWQGYLSDGRYNAVRLMDHSVGRFIEMAKKEHYFNNTIFVFHGDHGIHSSASPQMPRSFDSLNLARFLSPLIIYAPGIINEPLRIQTVASEIDVFPTLAGMAGIEYTNKTMGRDLLNTFEGMENYSPLLSNVRLDGMMGVMSERFILWRDHYDKRISLHDLHSDEPQKNVKESFLEETSKLSQLAEAMYETSRYMLHFNPTDKAQ